MITSFQKTIILMVLTLVVLAIPAASISYAEASKVDYVVSIQATYVNGTAIEVGAFNTTRADEVFNIQTELTPEANYDSMLFAYRNNGTTTTRRTAEYVNAIDYIGNNTYSVTNNYSDITTNYNNRVYAVQLDMVNGEFNDFDFVRITHTNDVALVVYYQTSSTGYNVIQPIQTTYGEFLIVNSMTQNMWMSNYPNGTIFVTWSDPYVWGEEEFTFSIEGFNFTPQDAMIWTDNQVYIMIVLGCDIILTIGLVFTTNFVDIKFDRESHKYQKKGKGKRWR